MTGSDLPGVRHIDAFVSGVKREISSKASTLFPGLAHRRRLASIDSKIVVSGSRGKSSLTRWLYEILHDREEDVYAKVTGNKPVSLYAGEEYPIERGTSVRLYENEDEIRKFYPFDSMVIENQAISSYTNRVVNDFFAHADVIVLTNMREDHLSTLGSDRYRIARSLVRSIPSGAHVVNGERDRALREYVDREVRQQGGTVSHVTVPEQYAHVPGIESVYALNHVLAAIGQEPLDDSSIANYRERMKVEWTRLPNGLIFNAAEVNDVQSTEMVRQALLRNIDATTVQPFLYLRGDRRGRTASFLRYLEGLLEEDPAAFETVHVAGPMGRVFERKADFPVVVHDATSESARSVLDTLLEKGDPVLLMGNTVAKFMREIDDEIQIRARRFAEERASEGGESAGSDSPTDDRDGEANRTELAESLISANRGGDDD